MLTEAKDFSYCKMEVHLYCPPVLPFFTNMGHHIWHRYQRQEIKYAFSPQNLLPIVWLSLFYVSVQFEVSKRELLANMLIGSCCSTWTSKCRCRSIMGCFLAHQISPMRSQKHIHSLYADVERRAIVNNICTLLEQIIFISCRKLNKVCLLWHNGQISSEEQQHFFQRGCFLPTKKFK